MEGTSIEQAKQALQLALDRLQPGDRFNVIEFNSVTRALFGAPMPVDPSTLARARRFVAALRARGGTEMKPALEAALTNDAAPGFVRQVVFLTDGAVGNERRAGRADPRSAFSTAACSRSASAPRRTRSS